MITCYWLLVTGYFSPFCKQQKNASPPKTRDEASILAVPPCLSRKTGPALSPWASQTTARLITAALPGPTTTFHVSRFTFCSPNSPAHSSASWLPRSHPRRLSEARFAATCPVHSRSYFEWREYATAVRGCQTKRPETALCPVSTIVGCVSVWGHSASIAPKLTYTPVVGRVAQDKQML